ncbi:hypothetical protein CO059_03110 [candidate division WWE3 bacterium CG_4_9_14_0_2_um_filter_48_10]|uniref:Uncharacterized protein n=1 Tax=candidate division WWE3 bacterium CG_4_9_14_0_2_um_filter_48_10 TaxID=1975078 RepID=A0A2M8EHR3_UNCKA|nr:MAG: hypothetical protein CO059_03110 [candidate division WWE3 bacterium CG_4_9_14_0_2_um_filter_48_10]
MAWEKVTPEEAVKLKTKRGGGFTTPTTICILCSLFALAFILFSFGFNNPYLILIGYFPAVVYEAIRTAGPYTKAASVGMVILTVLEALALKGIIKFNLATFLDQETAYVKGYWIPLGDVAFVFPLITIVLAILLFQRTAGRYTKWLSIIILVSSAALLLQVDKGALIEAIRTYLRYEF